MQENKKGMGELDITPQVLAEMVGLIDEGGFFLTLLQPN
jgi:hypothetical protein